MRLDTGPRGRGIFAIDPKQPSLLRTPVQWTRFIELLRRLRRHDGRLVRMLEDAANNQLDALGACVGAREL